MREVPIKRHRKERRKRGELPPPRLLRDSEPRLMPARTRPHADVAPGPAWCMVYPEDGRWPMYREEYQLPYTREEY